MDRLFLDANVLFSAAHRPEGRLLRLWKLDDVTLCSSRYALEERGSILPTNLSTRGLQNCQNQFCCLRPLKGPCHTGFLCLQKTYRFYSLQSKLGPLIS